MSMKISDLEANIEYSWWPGSFILCKPEILGECADFYSEHYGVWSDQGIHPGKRVQLSPERLKQWLESDDVSVYFARKKNRELLGYAIALNCKTSSKEVFTWVTQLVVHKEYRNKGIAKNLLFSIWGFSDHFAWGIVSANPYAVRALEKATRRRATPLRIKKNETKIRRIGENKVPYINKGTKIVIDTENSKIDTAFFVDHTESLKSLEKVISNENPWLLGMIDEGWEWLAFTFKDQEQINLTPEEIDNMIRTADSVVKNAYSRMTLDTRKHLWMKNTVPEVDFIADEVGLDESAHIYDFGCGQGRHAIEFGKRGHIITGIDYIEDNIISAVEEAKRQNLKNVKFEVEDCRHYSKPEDADLVLCLYDVIGSYADEESNMAILNNICKTLKKGGKAVISVMNYETTVEHAKHTFSFKDNPSRLLEIEGSGNMQNTGEVFDPEHYLIDVDTHLVYRREQFDAGNKIPVELIVRDRRFTLSEITSMCKTAGLSVISSRFTHATNWRDNYSANDKKAKEILLICEK